MWPIIFFQNTHICSYTAVIPAAQWKETFCLIRLSLDTRWEIGDDVFQCTNILSYLYIYFLSMMFIHLVHVSIFTKIEILPAKFIVIFVEKGKSLSNLFWWVFAFQIQDLFESGKATRWEHFKIIKHKMSKSQSTGLAHLQRRFPICGPYTILNKWTISLKISRSEGSRIERHLYTYK